MRYQFDTCSYDELTRCVQARIEWLREVRSFLADPVTKKYHHVRFHAALDEWTYKVEIKRLLKMRRVLKSSITKQWNTDYFTRRGEWSDVD